MGLRAGLDWYGKFHPHRDSIPGPFISYLVAIQTGLYRPNFTFRTASKVSTSEIQAVSFLSFHKLGRLSLYEFIHLFLRAWSQDRTLTLNYFFMKLSIVKKNTT